MIKIVRKDTNNPNEPEWIIHLNDNDLTRFVTHELLRNVVNIGIPRELAEKLIMKVFSIETAPNDTPGFDGIQEHHPMLAAMFVAKHEHIQSIIRKAKDDSKENK